MELKVLWWHRCYGAKCAMKPKVLWTQRCYGAKSAMNTKPTLDSLCGSSVKIGTMQRRFACPLRKDDMHKSRSVNIFVVGSQCCVLKMNSSTDQAWCHLTSKFRRDPVYLTQYFCQRCQMLPKCRIGANFSILQLGGWFQIDMHCRTQL